MLVCKLCNKEFIHNTNYKKVYCSKECFADSKRINGEVHHNWKGRKKEFECLNCNKKFKRYLRARGKLPKYCSQRCSGLHTARKGMLNNKWKGGITPENQKIRHSIEHRLWREAIFARDGWKCQKCLIYKLEQERELHPHHIYNFAEYPELRFAIDNVITLCKKHHIEFHKIFNKKKNNMEQINKYLYDHS